MRKKLLILSMCFLMLCLASASFGWQGRMEGMDNPSGLISDESDLFIHPAKILDGTGSNYYGFYKFNYTQVPKWNNIFTFTTPSGTSTTFPFVATGSEKDHTASLGGTWQAGPGRFGLFLRYDTKDGSYNGTDIHGTGAANHDEFSFDTDNRSFDAKLIYGMPLGSWKLGTELGYASKTYIYSSIATIGSVITTTNGIIGARDPQQNTFAYGVPVDFRWRELSFKVSAEKEIGPGVLTFTPRIATMLHGRNEIDNQFKFFSVLADNIQDTARLTGWNTGADLWYRVKLNDTTALPFIASASYDRKRSDISTFDTAANEPVSLSTESKEFALAIGGGIDKDLSKQTKIASGLYYNYLKNKTMFAYIYPTNSLYTVANNETPNEIENRIVWKSAVEHIFSPAFAARAGFNAFYGWVRDNYDFINTIALGSLGSQTINTSGHRWGVSVSTGATVKVAKLSIEPFVAAGLQKTKLDDSNGSLNAGANLTPVAAVSLQTEKSEWTVGGGVAVKF